MAADTCPMTLNTGNSLYNPDISLQPSEPLLHFIAVLYFQLANL
jgi:hypothetical protein